MNQHEYAIFGEDLGSSSSPSSSSSADDAMVIDNDPATSDLFVNATAEHFYDQALLRPIRIERRFEAPSIRFTNLIHYHNWSRLTWAPVMVNMEVVREFYVNSRADSVHSVFLRGQFLRMDRRQINAYYHLQNFPNDTYHRMVRAEDTDQVLAMVLEGVAIPGATWVRNTRNEAISVLSRDLTAVARMWLLFINSRLMPANQSTSVSRAKVLLIYAIEHRFSIDIGKIILGCIRQAQRSEIAPLFFPILISEMAREQGIDIDFPTPPHHSLGPMGTLDWQTYLEDERQERIRRGI